MPYRTLEALTEARRNQAAAADELLGEGLGQLLAGLYTENAHFVFELLQNAEDARATEVSFDLKASRLVFTHNGADPFTLADIESITTIKSTKKDDATKIGQFGVGFKAVFSYTARPEIRSGEYSFAIENLFVPVLLKESSATASTIFTLPFDRPDKPKQVAQDEIAQRLQELDESTLLFLRNIRSIGYRLSDGTRGRISRDEGDYPHVSITRKSGGESATSHWLRLTGGSKLSTMIPKNQMVSAAFHLDGPPPTVSDKRGSKKSVKVEPLTKAATCVYFPAASERSGLKFHVHAPFAPTPSRDSVKQGPDNDELFDAIGRLVASELPRLRDAGWISNGILDALPNPDDQLDPRYAAIRDRINAGFWSQKVTPVVKGGYSKASELVNSPSEFRTALDLSDLSFLTSLLDSDYPAKPKWVVDRAGRAGSFLSGLDIAPFGWAQFNDVFGVALRGKTDAWRVWLHKKPVDKLRAFYELLGQGFEDSRFTHAWNIQAFNGPLLRVRDGRASTIVSPTNTYLPTTLQDPTPGRVLASLAYFDGDEHTKSKARLAAFFAGFNVRRWDERARVEERLEAYRAKQRPDLKTHLSDLRTFAAHIISSPRDIRLFEDVRFLKVAYPGEDYRWASSSAVYLDKPFRPTGLSKIHSTAQGPFLLHPSYRGKVEGLEELVLSLGGVNEVQIVKAEPRNNPQWQDSWYPYDRQETSLGVKSDYDIPGLPQILASKDNLLLRSLWSCVIIAPETNKHAYYQLNQRARTYRMDSRLAQRLLESPWVLDRRGKLRSPTEMSFKDLPDGWPEPRPDSLAIALGFGAEAREREEKTQERRQVAAQAGIPVELLEALDALPKAERDSAVQKFRAQLTSRASFPGNTSANPDRRAAVLSQEAPSAPDHTTTQRTRRVVLGRHEATSVSKQYLEAEYTDNADAMRCQGCQQTMPFRKLDGSWYFEAIQFVPKRAKMHRENALAMCPLCAALYSHARSTPDALLYKQLFERAEVAEAGRVTLPISLNGRVIELFFTERHAVDLVTVLEVAGDPRGNKAGAT